MLKNSVRSEVKQEVKKEMQPFVLLPTYVYLIGIVGGLILSIWREWSLAVSGVSIVCMLLDTFFSRKVVIGHPSALQVAPEDDVVVDTEPEWGNK